MPTPPKEIHLTYACGHSETFLSPGPADPSGVYANTVPTPGDFYNLEDYILKCRDCKTK